MVTYKRIPEIPKAVCILHKGPSETLVEAYAYILKWIEENNFVISDHARESYIDGIWNKENQEEWLTEIQVPIK
ncbi:MAG: GyrI-like domain-containing protein [Leptotrichiaceae bacterium]|nr:GyrI-like domain-containing protein [Leptotrichiaceae bacterium]